MRTNRALGRLPHGQPATVRLIFRYALVAIRLYLGAWMLLNGLNHFLPIFPQPMGGAMKSSQLMVTLVETGLFDLVKSTEVVVGVLLLTDYFVPVALVVALPVSVVVWYNHAVLNGKPFDVSMGIGCLVWNLVLLLGYLRYYVPMLRARATIGALDDFKRLPEVTACEPSADAPESRHRLAAVMVGLLITVVVGYRLHPTVQQPAGSGLTPAKIVTDYMHLAYVEGRKRDADAMYLSPDLASREASGEADDAPSPLRTAEVIGQGSSVAVLSVATGPGDAPLEIVDMYRVARSMIVEHTRVEQRPSHPSEVQSHASTDQSTRITR